MEASASPVRESGRVSVIIPTFNNAADIAEAIDSALNQSYSNLEVIVIDDGSTDNTAHVVGSYGQRVRYIKQQNKGASGARNHGIRQATGEWIAFLDSDDIWLREKVHVQVSDLKNLPQALIHSTNISLQRESLETDDFFKSIGFNRCEQGSQRTLLEYPFYEILKFRFPWLQSSLFHHSVFDEIGGLNEDYPIYEDYDFLCRAAIGRQWVVNATPLVKILRRDGKQNLSQLRTEKVRESLETRLRIHRELAPLACSSSPQERRLLKKRTTECYQSLLKHDVESLQHDRAKALMKELGGFPKLMLYTRYLCYRWVNRNKTKP